MFISDFKYHKPKTLAEASELLMQSKNGAVIAGGTDILVEIKNGLRKFSDIVSLSLISELKDISEDSDNIYIGAGVTHSNIIKSDLIIRKLPALSEAASKIGSHQIRNVGTVGGNLCTGASCADTAPIFMAYDSSVELVNGLRKRVVKLNEFLINHHKTDVGKGEIMTKVIVPKSEHTTRACFEKFGLREAVSVSVASTAVVLRFDKGICISANIVIGACGPTPILSNKAKAILEGKTVDEIMNNPKLREDAANAAAGESLPIDDIRGSADYRRELVRVLTGRAIDKAVTRLGKNNN